MSRAKNLISRMLEYLVVLVGSRMVYLPDLFILMFSRLAVCFGTP
jgi:hypothetical protein